MYDEKTKAIMREIAAWPSWKKKAAFTTEKEKEILCKAEEMVANEKAEERLISW